MQTPSVEGSSEHGPIDVARSSSSVTIGEPGRSTSQIIDENMIIAAAVNCVG